MDLMRLPLGILSGMGFIGAGAILRRDNLVVGVTTAATLWFVTVMGLCFGGGQIGLGVVAAVMGIIILRGLRWVEKQCRHGQHALLRIVAGPGGPTEEQVTGMLRDKGYTAGAWSVVYSESQSRRELVCNVQWKGILGDTGSPPFLSALAQSPDVLELEWNRETEGKKTRSG